VRPSRRGDRNSINTVQRERLFYRADRDGGACRRCEPLGAFEIAPFDTATVALARTAAALTKEGQLTSVAGGGDTVAALNHAGAAADFTFVSTAGGAFLEWMEGKDLPGVKALMV